VQVCHERVDVIEGYIEDRIGESEKSNQRLDKGTRDFEPIQLIRCVIVGHCSSPWWGLFYRVALEIVTSLGRRIGVRVSGSEELAVMKDSSLTGAHSVPHEGAAPPVEYLVCHCVSSALRL